LIKFFIIFFFVLTNAHGNFAERGSVSTKNKYFFFKQEKQKLHVEENFCYIEFSYFPTQIEENTFGAAIGYRMAITPSIGNDFSFHIMKTLNGDLHICGKANHLYYIMGKKPTFSPYFGFGIIAGVAPANDQLIYRSTKEYEDPNENNDYTLLVNGEIVLGVEFVLNTVTKQFFELTYYAQSPTLQLSFGIGF